MRGKWIKLCIIMFCFTLCYGCSKKEEREMLAEVQTIEEDSKEPQKEQKEKQNEEGEAEGGKICVYVCGQVVEPGVYELKNTSRLYEAVQAAGGMTETAADTYLNQAESLKDGQKIYVPSRE